jgi:hypothetical protein
MSAKITRRSNCLECSCGFICKNDAVRQMIKHLLNSHNIWYVGIGIDIQKLSSENMQLKIKE